MYIKSIVVDGFKSYAQRTEINGFDPLFNAITGLNGSGKSNILDSICFLLGITNLTQVRATNLQELVYKNGQAGVTKATVSITFDNADKKQSPLGYEQYEEITVTRQVVIGGRNKYLINGNNANNTRVQDMFRSVQLNVNNPHFLIMQGRITKVLNMKPPEILSMIEEAAGTRLYESKKESAQKTIEKKDAKLKEIDTILKEEITPTLSRLKEERSSYLEFQKVTRELDHLNKVVIAYKYIHAEETKQKAAQDLISMRNTIQEVKDQQKEHSDKIDLVENDIKELEHRRDQERGGILQKLESDLAEKQKLDALAQSNITHKKESMKAEQKKQRELEKSKKNDKASVDNKNKELAKIQQACEQFEQQGKDDEARHEAAQKKFHAISAGLSSNTEGEETSLNDQLMTAQKDKSDAQTELKKSQMGLKHDEQELKKKSSDLKKTEQSYKRDQNAHDSLKKSVEKLQAEVDKIQYQEGLEENLSQERRKIKSDYQNLKDTVEQKEARINHMNFEYTDPVKNFDRRRVRGLVAQLIEIKHPETTRALEIAVGGKLYNVIVDTDQTSKLLLNQGRLKKRVTIIPLNQIKPYPIDSRTSQHADKLVGKGNARVALSLIGYPDDVEKAMAYCFGGIFVCKDMSSAKKVTYDPNIRKPSVTLEGDVFSPEGTLSGGSRQSNFSLLASLSELNAMKATLHEKETLLRNIEKELSNIQHKAARWAELKKQLDLKQSETQLLEDKLRQGTHGQQLEEIDALQNAIDAHKQCIQASKEKEAKSSQREKDIKDRIKNAKAIREKELKTSEEEVKNTKKQMVDSGKKMKEKQQEVESIRLEIVELEKEIANCEEQLLSTADAIKGFQDQINQLQEAASETKDAVKQAQDCLNKQKDVLKATDNDIKKKMSEQKQLQKDVNNCNLRVQELEHSADKCGKQSTDSARQVENLLMNYDWIADEKKFFGQPHTAYDFEANNPQEASRRLQKLQETKEKLSKSVNMRAMNMLGKAEEQYNELMKKRKIVLNDKNKIATVIEELDKKKNEALTTAHTQVNKDFGSIFSTLLPGTQAKLVAPDGASILDGLEVKVAFGDVWKESLSELSGGQRSLVALSLILSLLLFKPAPLYILDEVDAALDLSHTQNIGQMLRTHFRHSQFIVVSLKDGMFNNANVLFKTKFVDGVSTVTRYVQNPSSLTRPAPTSSEQGGSNRGKGKGKGKSTKRARTDASPLVDHNEMD